MRKIAEEDHGGPSTTLFGRVTCAMPARIPRVDPGCSLFSFPEPPTRRTAASRSRRPHGIVVVQDAALLSGLLSW